jgi:hypothetical protein
VRSDVQTFIQTHPHQTVVDALSGRMRARRLQDRILVPTDVLLPNGGNVVAIVEGGQASAEVTVTDGGAALAQVMDAGLDVSERVIASARRAAARHGLTLEGTLLRAPAGAVEDVVAGVLHLANAARDVAVEALDAARRQERSRFRDRVLNELRRIFVEGSVQARAPLRGFSEETLHVDWLVTLPGGARLALDTPVPDHSSVAAAVMRHLDLAATQPAGLRQAIAYDEHDVWGAGELRQLQLAQVPVI